MLSEYIYKTENTSLEVEFDGNVLILTQTTSVGTEVITLFEDEETDSNDIQEVIEAIFRLKSKFNEK